MDGATATDIASLLARIVLAVVFGVSGAAKFTDQNGTRTAIAKLVSPKFEFLAPVLPTLELLLAFGILLPATSFPAGLLSVGLLVLFSVLIRRAMGQENPPTCHCFGQLGAAQPVSTQMIFRNFALITLALIAAVF